MDLAELLPSWELHLRAEHQAAETLRLRSFAARSYLAWCETHGYPADLDRPTVTAYIADLLDQGRAPATAYAYQSGLKQLSRWLADEGIRTPDPLLGLRPPRQDVPVVPVLSADQLKALVGACQGPGLLDRRDEAAIRLMAETGIRIGELAAMAVADVDLATGVAVVRRGKGGRGRVVPIGPVTGRAIDRYLRTRRQHGRGNEPALWVGGKGKGCGPRTLGRAMTRRAELAGISNFHPHILRHTAASRWLAAGGSEGGLMSVAGWSRRDMIDRYVQATRSELAADEARKLGLGDL
jgi:site-specific recombinase XerD